MSDQLYDQWQEAVQRARKAEQQLAQVTAGRDTLVADLRQRQAGQQSAEEQLAQAREENKHLYIQFATQGQMLEAAQAQIDTLLEQNAALRTLLEDACAVIKQGSYGNEYPEEIEAMEDAIARYRAFLAQRAKEEK